MLISYFNAGIKNPKPALDATPEKIANGIAGNPMLADRTARLRAAEGEEQDEMKKQLPYVTWAGTFEKRGDQYLKQPSGLLVLDFDGHPAAAALRDTLADDPFAYIVFLSPRATGVKLVVRHNFELYKDKSGKWRHVEVYRQIMAYFVDAYDLAEYADHSGSDVSRACFLCHDPDLRINRDAQTWEYVAEAAPQSPARSSGTKGTTAWAKTVQELTRQKEYFAPGNRNNYVHKAAQDQKRLGVSEADAMDAILEMAEAMGAGDHVEEYRNVIRGVYAREPEAFGARAFVVAESADEDDSKREKKFRPDLVKHEFPDEDLAETWQAIAEGQAGWAALFAKHYAHTYIYDYPLSSDKGWMEYRRGRWKYVEGPVPRQALAGFVNERTEQLSDYFRNACQEAMQAGDKKLGRKLFAMLKFAQDERRRTDAHKWRNDTIREAALTAEMSTNTTTAFDDDPNLLNLRNGVLNLTTGEVVPHHHSQRFLHQTRAGWNTEATAPTFLKTLEYLFGDDEDGKLDLLAFQQYAGLCLAGHQHVQGFYYIYGDGGGGKSTLARALELALGSYAVIGEINALTTDRAGETGRRAMEVRLPHARMLSCAEVPAGKWLDESYVKRMTGGDTMTARRLYSEAFEFTPKFNLLIVGNDKLRIQGQNAGIWRRIKFLRIRHGIPEAARKDHELIENLLKAEADGVLQWMYAGWQAYQARVAQGLGLYVSPRIEVETKEYKRDNDALNDYVSERMIQDDKGSVKLMDLWRDYTAWVDAKAEDRMFKSSRSFGAALEERGKRATRDYKNQKVIAGWRLLTHEELMLREKQPEPPPEPAPTGETDPYEPPF